MEDVEAAVDGDDALALARERPRRDREARDAAPDVATRCPEESPPASRWPCRTCRPRHSPPCSRARPQSRDPFQRRGPAQTRRRRYRRRRSRRTPPGPASARRTARCCHSTAEEMPCGPSVRTTFVPELRSQRTGDSAGVLGRRLGIGQTAAGRAIPSSWASGSRNRYNSPGSAGADRTMT